MSGRPQPEGKILSACLEWLALRRIFAHRNNTGAVKMPDGAWVRFGHPGSADIYGILPVVVTPDMVGRTLGIFTGVECKTLKGKQRENQKFFQQVIEKNGGIYVVARSVDDLAAGLERYIPGR